MQTYFKILLGLCLLSGVANAALWQFKKDSKEKEEAGYCSSAKEYITVLEYLRDDIKLAGSEPKARWVADEVSKNCTGAAKRFIGTAKLLNKVEFSNAELLKIAMSAASSSNAKAESFKIIFSKAYLEDELDLDVQTALKIANDLSFDFSGDSDWAQKEFSKIVNFCTNKDSKKIHLNKVDCAKLASTLIDKSKSDVRDISSDFINLYEFLISDKNAAISQGQAVDLSKEILQYGPMAKDNFIQAFEYAKNKKGLGLSNEESISFSKKIASRSLGQSFVISK